MAPKGLKVGDTYDNGGEIYRITKVVSDEFYESEWVGETSPVTLTADIDYNTMPYATLKKLCAEKGLNAKGSKEELIARLEG